MGYYERPGQVAKDIFGPYLVWIAIAAAGLWPHFVWRGTVGWVVTGIWLGIVVIPIAALTLISKAKADRKP
jgi:hypothetical protein